MEPVKRRIGADAAKRRVGATKCRAASGSVRTMKKYSGKAAYPGGLRVGPAGPEPARRRGNGAVDQRLARGGFLV